MRGKKKLDGLETKYDAQFGTVFQAIIFSRLRVFVVAFDTRAFAACELFVKLWRRSLDLQSDGGKQKRGGMQSVSV